MDPSKPAEEKEVKDWVERNFDSLFIEEFPDAFLGEWMRRFGDYIFRFLSFLYQTPSTPQDCERRKVVFQKLLEEQSKMIKIESPVDENRTARALPVITNLMYLKRQDYGGLDREQIDCWLNWFRNFKDTLGQGNSNKDVQLQNLVEFVDNIKRQTDILLRCDECIEARRNAAASMCHDKDAQVDIRRPTANKNVEVEMQNEYWNKSIRGSNKQSWGSQQRSQEFPPKDDYTQELAWQSNDQPWERQGSQYSSQQWKGQGTQDPRTSQMARQSQTSGQQWGPQNEDPRFSQALRMQSDARPWEGQQGSQNTTQQWEDDGLQGARRSQMMGRQSQNGDPRYSQALAMQPDAQTWEGQQGSQYTTQQRDSGSFQGPGRSQMMQSQNGDPRYSQAQGRQSGQSQFWEAQGDPRSSQSQGGRASGKYSLEKWELGGSRVSQSQEERYSSQVQGQEQPPGGWDPSSDLFQDQPQPSATDLGLIVQDSVVLTHSRVPSLRSVGSDLGLLANDSVLVAQSRSRAQSLAPVGSNLGLIANDSVQLAHSRAESFAPVGSHLDEIVRDSDRTLVTRSRAQSIGFVGSTLGDIVRDSALVIRSRAQSIGPAGSNLGEIVQDSALVTRPRAQSIGFVGSNLGDIVRDSALVTRSRAQSLGYADGSNLLIREASKETLTFSPSGSKRSVHLPRQNDAGDGPTRKAHKRRATGKSPSQKRSGGGKNTGKKAAPPSLKPQRKKPGVPRFQRMSQPNDYVCAYENLAALPAYHPLKTPYPPHYRFNEKKIQQLVSQCGPQAPSTDRNDNLGGNLPDQSISQPTLPPLPEEESPCAYRNVNYGNKMLPNYCYQRFSPSFASGRKDGRTPKKRSPFSSIKSQSVVSKRLDKSTLKEIKELVKGIAKAVKKQVENLSFSGSSRSKKGDGEKSFERIPPFETLKNYIIKKSGIGKKVQNAKVGKGTKGGDSKPFKSQASRQPESKSSSKTRNSVKSKSESKEKDYQKVYDAIANILQDPNYDDGSYGPVFVRLAWHSSGTYDSRTGTGGSYRCTTRFQPESGYFVNTGLGVARDKLEGIKKQFPWISYGDLYTLAGVASIQEMGGPTIPWRPGRVDGTAADCPPEGRLPDGRDENAQHHRDTYGRMGFNDQETAALVGAHTLGRAHTNRSGFDGPWTLTPTTFSNRFYVGLLNREWVEKDWKGPKQFVDKKTGRLMMLPSDLVFMNDAGFRKWAEVYAEDETKFFEDFAKAFQKLLELGVPFKPDTPEYRFTTAGE